MDMVKLRIKTFKTKRAFLDWNSRRSKGVPDALTSTWNKKINAVRRGNSMIKRGYKGVTVAGLRGLWGVYYQFLPGVVIRVRRRK